MLALLREFSFFVVGVVLTICGLFCVMGGVFQWPPYLIIPPVAISISTVALHTYSLAKMQYVKKK